MGNRKGTILIIALMTVAFLGALAVAVMNPTTTADKVATEAYNYKRATMAANSAAEQVKYIMCQLDATADMGTSACIARLGWTPSQSYETNGYKDTPGITFPSMDMVDNTGHPVFDIENPDIALRPQTIGQGDYQARFITFTTTDAAGKAISYVSAEYDGEVRSMRVNYRRLLQSELPHESYLHAAYAANLWGIPGYIFELANQGLLKRVYLDWNTRNALNADRELSSRGVLNIKSDQTKGYLGFKIPDADLKPGTKPSVNLYLNNVPNKDGATVSIRLLDSPTTSWITPDDMGATIGEVVVDKKDGHMFIPFEFDPEVFEKYRGQTMNVTFTVDEGEGGPASEVHFKFKGRGTDPALEYEIVGGEADNITGDIFINGDADIAEGDVDGTTKATGDVIGDGTGDEMPGYDYIKPPDLSKSGDWYQDLQITHGGNDSNNPDVVTDLSDGLDDNRIAGIIVPHTETGENQDYMDDDATSAVTYVIDSNFGQMAGWGDPTYNSETDSVIVTVPEEYNNKAIYIPGDFWCDILDPTFIDFRCKRADGSLEPVNLTFIVEGNTYLTDGVNRKKHPDSGPGGLISFISLKNASGEGGNIFYGDPSAGGGRLDPVKAFMYAENDFAWLPQAMGAGDFDIIGNMTASGLIDLTARGEGEEFRPVDLQFDPAILDPEVRDSLPGLPAAAGSDIVPGTPFQLENSRYID